MKHAFWIAIAVCTGLATAQRPPLPGIPMTPPPVNHPALGSQPLFQPPPKKPEPPPPPAPAPDKSGGAAPNPIDPELVGPQLAGKDLVAALAKATALPRHATLAAAQTAAVASGKPILWLQALGTLDGLASSVLQSLRGTTLANDEVLQQLRDHFEFAGANIERAPHVGLSDGYRPDQTAMGMTTGAGGRNVQIVVLAADGAVLLALPGYWHALDLLPELQLARQLHDLYRSTDHTSEQKLVMMRTLHRAFVRGLSPGTLARSAWREADVLAENERSLAEVRDTFVLDGAKKPKRDAAGRVVLNPLVHLVHERLRAVTFTAWRTFDMEKLVDYGSALHDENQKTEVGVPFPGAVQNQQRRERERKVVKKSP